MCTLGGHLLYLTSYHDISWGKCVKVVVWCL